MATNARDTAVGALLDELLLDIFGRLPDPIDLLRCAGTCRRWLRAVAADDAAFLRRAGVLPEKNNRPSLLLGALYQNFHLVPGSAAPAVNRISDCPPRFWRIHGLARLGSGLSSILPNHDGTFSYAKPLTSRHGLLLARLLPPPADYGTLHLAVCHPLLGGVHHVPPPPVLFHAPYQGRDVTGYALLAGRRRRQAFRVLFTAVSLDGAEYACSYSSATGSWTTPTTCPPQLQGLTMSGPRAGLVDDGRGTAHWLYRDEASFYTLDVTADASRVSLTKTPIPVEADHERRLQPPFPCIAEGGKVSFVSIRPGSYDHELVLTLWTKRDRQDHNNGEEDYVCSVRTMSQMPFKSFKITGFAQSRGAILLETYSGLFCLDLESRGLELVRGSEYSVHSGDVCSSSACQGYYSCTGCTYNNFVLYEMDWSSYLLHLSAWS